VVTTRVLRLLCAQLTEGLARFGGYTARGSARHPRDSPGPGRL